jgi:hypothetical protein
MTHKVALNVTVRSAVLQKYRVQVHLEEPKLEQGGDSKAVPLDEDISTLTAFEAIDSEGITVTSMSEKKEWAAIHISLAIASGGDSDSTSKKNQHELSFNKHSAKDDRHLRGILSPSESGQHFAAKERTRENSFHVSIALSEDDKDFRPKVMKSQSQLGLPDVGVGSKTPPQFSQNTKPPIPIDTIEKPLLIREGSIRDNFNREASNREGFSREGFSRPASSDLPQITSSRPPGKKGKIKTGTKTEQKFNNLVSFINHTRKNKGDIGDVLNKWSKLS